MRTAPHSVAPSAGQVPSSLGVSVRAALALALLAGFYLLALGIIGGLVAVDVLLALNSAHPFGIGGLKVYTLSAVLAYPVLRTVFLIRRPGPGIEPPEGLPVSPADQPALWARVGQLAELSGAPRPDELWLFAEAN